ncbi:hypothetical protein GRI97_01180 [Altererythrobacter xixiisoli]|uniref:Uncharacterized protein n=1 Tax=Croceibacterium xixiisoli TaxID=1476466 RepID=A0A6I4TR49_9SPHN|nr:hypothetical protein [Croceibacterium xixiisoli]
MNAIKDRLPCRLDQLLQPLLQPVPVFEERQAVIEIHYRKHDLKVVERLKGGHRKPHAVDVGVGNNLVSSVPKAIM